MKKIIDLFLFICSLPIIGFVAIFYPLHLLLYKITAYRWLLESLHYPFCKRKIKRSWKNKTDTELGNIYIKLTTQSKFITKQWYGRRLIKELEKEIGKRIWGE